MAESNMSHFSEYLRSIRNQLEPFKETTMTDDMFETMKKVLEEGEMNKRESMMESSVMARLNNTRPNVCNTKLLTKRSDNNQNNTVCGKINYKYQGVNLRHMMYEMVAAAVSNKRTIVDDVRMLVSIFLIRNSNNITKILETMADDKNAKDELKTMKKVYNILDSAPGKLNPTLSRISQACPIVTFNIARALGNSINLPVADYEIGCCIPLHVKLLYFPSLVLIDDGDEKVQAAFLLHNLYHTKVTIKTLPVEERRSDRSRPGNAFASSCNYSLLANQYSLATNTQRKAFTELIKCLDITVEMVSTVWNKVMTSTDFPSDIQIPTMLHKKLIKKTPSDFEEWKTVIGTLSTPSKIVTEEETIKLFTSEYHLGC